MPIDPQPDRTSRRSAACAAAALRADRPQATSADRTAEIRRRVLAGAYDSPAVVHEVARRMLASGDLNR